jgi:hypothetical protein
MMNMKEELYKSLVDGLIYDKDGSIDPKGHDTWCWLRKRAGKHYEESYWAHEAAMDGEDFGSSDLSCYLYNLWIQYGQDSLDDNFGWWINGEICDLMDIPNTKATREYHNTERA